MIAGILTKWAFDPTVIIGVLGLVAAYWLYTRGPRSNRGAEPRSTDARFAAAIVLAILALESPLDFLADRYLFSAHMVQHLVLLLGVAPLLARSIPAALFHQGRRLPRWLKRLLTQPALVFVAFVADLWAWHAPPLYEATLRSESVHVLEHLSFVATATVFWWIAFDDGRMPVLARMGYVFVAGIPNTLLGALITFAPSVLYPSYQLALEQPGLGRLLQAKYGVTALGDQELGGLLMWVPGGFVYLLAIVGIFISWFANHQAVESGVRVEY
ncbi:MAG TPA: cytochrome c oxidase assembly protein [Chloroflexota bacterium]|nr:cytochrome c oxidase assembly protein [Chloroflexota bacterium]